MSKYGLFKGVKSNHLEMGARRIFNILAPHHKISISGINQLLNRTKVIFFLNFLRTVTRQHQLLGKWNFGEKNRQWASTFCGDETIMQDMQWVFMQDSAPSHTAWETRNLLENQCPDYLKSEEWLSNSPDCHPMDYGVWEVFEQKVFDGHSSFATLAALKRRRMKHVWDQLYEDWLKNIIVDKTRPMVFGLGCEPSLQ
ncbi:MAG: hypothetical protein GY821_09005 [Gammaproteobacteria bacterium]|nr:hypothetical protein [Gammaproteobacteria bacterium]